MEDLRGSSILRLGGIGKGGGSRAVQSQYVSRGGRAERGANARGRGKNARTRSRSKRHTGGKCDREAGKKNEGGLRSRSKSKVVEAPEEKRSGIGQKKLERRPRRKREGVKKSRKKGGKR